MKAEFMNEGAVILRWIVASMSCDPEVDCCLEEEYVC
jgi:hypothetical protein